jgi:G3E family GTPase
LLAEQVESADMLLLNKADIATPDELAQTQAMVAALNEVATIRATEYGKVNVEEFLAVDLGPGSDAQESDAPSPNKIEEPAEEPVKACCAAKTCSSTNKESTTDCGSSSESEQAPSRAQTRFGITSFVYRTERMMSRVKLIKQLGEWQKARDQLGNKLSLVGLSDDSAASASDATKTGAESTGSGSPMTPILRSKGILLLDANPEVAFYWSHAGKSVSFSVFGPWPENAPVSQGGFGEKRTELVFIGTDYEEAAIRAVLDSCLMSDQELEVMKRIQSS